MQQRVYFNVHFNYVIAFGDHSNEIFVRSSWPKQVAKSFFTCNSFDLESNKSISNYIIYHFISQPPRHPTQTLKIPPTTMANPIVANISSNFKPAPQCSTNGRSNNAFLKENNSFRPVIVQENGRVAVPMTDARSQEQRPAPQAFHMSSFEYSLPAQSSSWDSNQSVNSIGSSSYNSSSMAIQNNGNNAHLARMIPRSSPRGPAEFSDSPNSFLSINFNYNNNDARKSQVFDNKKKKTELCKHFQKNGVCPYGDCCNYAHGEKDRVSFENVEDMVRAGVIVDSTNYMCRPCIIFVSTGSW